MRKGKTLRKLGLIALFAMGFTTLNAQVCWPVVPSNNVGASPQVQNTGNDIADYTGAPFGDISVTAYDGANPGVDWFWNGMSGVIPLPPSTYDPDIVLDPTGTGDFVVVYVDNATNLITYEKHCWTGFGYALCSGPAPIHSAPGRNPNIDAQVWGTRLVVVWEESSGIINAKAGDFAMPGVFFPSVYIVTGGCSNRQGWQPDVAMNDNGDVWFTFLWTNTGTPVDVVAVYDNWGNVQAGGIGPCTMTNVFSINPLTESLGPPRIAMPHGTLNEHQIVVTYITGGSFSYILGFNLVSGWAPTIINQVCPSPPTPLVQFKNLRPVVSYAEAPSEINVAWMFDDGSNGPSVTGSNNLDVLVQRLDNAGNVINCACVMEAEINNMSDYQVIPSISGKASPQNVFNYSWQEINSTRIWNKAVWAGSPNLKMAPESIVTDITAFPNPFTNELKLDFWLKEGEVVNSIKVYNMTGQMVHSFDLSHITEGKNQLKMDKQLPLGLYIVNYESSMTTETIKVSKVE